MITPIDDYTTPNTLYDGTGVFFCVSEDETGMTHKSNLELLRDFLIKEKEDVKEQLERTENEVSDFVLKVGVTVGALLGSFIGLLTRNVGFGGAVLGALGGAVSSVITYIVTQFFYYPYALLNQLSIGDVEEK